MTGGEVAVFCFIVLIALVASCEEISITIEKDVATETEEDKPEDQRTEDEVL